jgi:hypothetical protein
VTRRRRDTAGAFPPGVTEELVLGLLHWCFDIYNAFGHEGEKRLLELRDDLAARLNRGDDPKSTVVLEVPLQLAGYDGGIQTPGRYVFGNSARSG